MESGDKVVLTLTACTLVVSIVCGSIGFVLHSQNAKQKVNKPVETQVENTIADDSTEVSDNTVTEIDDTESGVDSVSSTDIVLKSKAYRKVVNKYDWVMDMEPELYDIIEKQNKQVFVFRYYFSHGEFRITYNEKTGKCKASKLTNTEDDTYPVVYWDMGSIPTEAYQIYDVLKGLGYNGVYRCDATDLDNIIVSSSEDEYTTISLEGY